MKHNLLTPEPNYDIALLDILYQNKNKEYGGYELRKNYNSRLKKSLITAFALIAILLISIVTKKADADVRLHDKPLSGGHKLKEVKIIACPKIMPDKPKKLMNEKKQMANIKPNKVLARTARVNIVVNTNQPTVTPAQTAVASPTNVTTTTAANVSNSVTNTAILTGGSNTNNNLTTSTSSTGIKGSAEVDQVPLYPGGDAALQFFLSKNLVYPEDARQKNAEAEIEIFFVVDVDGSIQQIKSDNIEHFGFVNEGKRVVGMMPKWRPAMMNGKPVKCYFSVPITYVLSQDDN
jgi:periplasmic protein TonB